MTQQELKSCPFCGGKASLRRYPIVPDRFVRCDDCGASTREFESVELNAQEACGNAAIKAWNRRYENE